MYWYHVPVPWRSPISHTGFKHDTQPASYSDLRAFRLRSRGFVAEHLPERQLRQPRQPRPDIKQTSNWKLRVINAGGSTGLYLPLTAIRPITAGVDLLPFLPSPVL